MSFSLSLTGHTLDVESERVIQEACRRFVRSLQTHTDNPDSRAQLFTATFSGSHGGAANLFNLSDKEADAARKAEEAANAEAEASRVPVVVPDLPEFADPDLDDVDLKRPPAEATPNKMVRFGDNGPEVLQQ